MTEGTDDADTKEVQISTLDVEVGCWYRFLAGQICCPWCGCCTFFGIGWFWTWLFLMKCDGFDFNYDFAETDDLFNFEESKVQSNIHVQEYYGFEAARGTEWGCGDERHETKNVCEGDEECEWTNGKCQEKAACQEPEPRTREGTLLYDDSAAWITIIYEAENNGNLFDDGLMTHVNNFETELLTTANGAQSKGQPSPWNEDWCMLAYPHGGAEGDGKCRFYSTWLNMFSMTEEAKANTERLVQEGFTESKALACMCGNEAQLCSLCTDSGELKGYNYETGAVDFAQMPSDVLNCMNSAVASNEDQSVDDTGMCDSMGSMTMDTLMPMLAGMCASKPSCEWAPPGVSWMCSSTAFYLATEGSGLVTGDAKNAVLDRICDEENTNWWNARRGILPLSLDCDQAVKKTSSARTFWLVGGSGEGKAEGKNFEENYVKGGNGWFASEQKLERKVEKESNGLLRIILFSAATIQEQWLSILMVDSMLSLGSLFMVWAFMWYILESAFLASAAMFEIVFSLPVVMSLWTVILQQKLSSFQMLTIYMILGIGADDAFILYDAWLQAPFTGDQMMANKLYRFRWAYKRSFKAMSITTATTCGSFLIGACSPLPQVRDFCIFAALVVFVDWLFVETLFASAVMLNESFFKTSKPKGAMCGPGCCCGLCRCVAKSICKQTYPAADAPPEMRQMEKFCDGPLFRCLSRGKKLLMAFWGFFILLALINAGVQLRTATKTSPIGRASLDAIRGAEILLEEYSVFGTPSTSVFWGLDEKEPVKEWGSTNADNEARFDASTAARLMTREGQVELLNLCRGADMGPEEDTRCDTRKCLILGRSQPGNCPRSDKYWKTSGVYLPEDVMCQTGRYCFMEEFARFWAFWVEGGQCPPLTTSQACSAESGCVWDVSLETCYSNVYTEADYAGLPQDEFMQHLTSDEFKQYLAMRERLQTEHGRGHDKLLGRQWTGYQTDEGKTKITFAYVSFNATYPVANTKEEAEDWYDRWQGFHDKYAPNIGGKQTTELYVFMVTQQEMIKAACLGIALSLVISFIVLVIATRNWRSSLIGLINIVGITGIFLGLMPLLDWSLGENECIFLIAVVGLSVDYTVHLIHCYNHGQSDSRSDRAQHALAEMGVSVTNSAMTTLLAASVLFGCGFYFFLQFGAFIFFVIGFSILMSITFLIPMLLLIGPEGSEGDLGCIHPKLSARKPVGNE